MREKLDYLFYGNSVIFKEIECRTTPIFTMIGLALGDSLVLRLDLMKDERSRGSILLDY